MAVNNTTGTPAPGSQANSNSMSLREIFEFLWRLRFWIIASAVAALVAAFFYVRMQSPVYQRSAWIRMNRNDGTGAEMELLSEFSGTGLSKPNVENEVFIIKSPTMMSKVVDELGLNYRYYHYAMPVADRLRFGRSLFGRKRVEYYEDNPFELSFCVDSLYPLEMRPSSFTLKFRNLKQEQYQVRELAVNGRKVNLDERKYAYGDTVALPGCKFVVRVTESEELINKDNYICSWTNSFNCARGFVKNLNVEAQGQKMKLNDVVVLTMNDTKAQRASDILNTLIYKVNDEARAYGNMAIVNTINFIDQRLEDISKDLGAAEDDYKRYQSSKIVVDINSQSQASIASDRQYTDQLNEVLLQLQVLDMISDYISEDNAGKYTVIPANIGINDAGLNSIIAAYNNMVAERNRMISNSSENNPRVLGLNAQLDDQKRSIEISVANLVRVYGIRAKELTKTIGAGKRKMADIPQQQFELQQLNRRLAVIEPLYLMLQQKREESQIRMYSQVETFRVIETAFGNPKPVSPNSMQIYLLAFILGCCIPPLVVWARMQLRTKVETKKDITDKLSYNILAVLPKHGEGENELISRNGRDVVSEAFRNLRSNLQYMPGCRVIQVTSSIAGEGKSFVSSNLALSLSHVGNKVLLIGLDIRKPRLNGIFTCKAPKYNSVVGYLIGRAESLDALVQPSGVSDTLDVIFAGPVPPNPTELLQQGRAKDIVDYFRTKYDYIIIDSAPYLPVSDSFIINSYADATLYTLRAGHTPLSILPEIQEALDSETRPVKNVSLVLNGMDLSAGKYRYGYGSGYGYGYGHGSGYGYGYGYGYGEPEPDKHSGHRKHAAGSENQSA